MAETDVPEVEKVEAPAVAPEKPKAQVEYVAMRDFKARFAHQLLSFSEGEVIEERIGSVLRLTGSPIKLVERSAKETKGRA